MQNANWDLILYNSRIRLLIKHFAYWLSLEEIYREYINNEQKKTTTKTTSQGGDCTIPNPELKELKLPKISMFLENVTI